MMAHNLRVASTTTKCQCAVRGHTIANTKRPPTLRAHDSNNHSICGN